MRVSRRSYPFEVFSNFSTLNFFKFARFEVKSFACTTYEPEKQIAILFLSNRVLVVVHWNSNNNNKNSLQQNLKYM